MYAQKGAKGESGVYQNVYCIQLLPTSDINPKLAGFFNLKPIKVTATVDQWSNTMPLTTLVWLPCTPESVENTSIPLSQLHCNAGQ